MNRKLLILILGLLLIAALIPWDSITLWDDKSKDTQAVIDSLEAEVEEAKAMYMYNGKVIVDLTDSLTSLSIIVERTNENYLKLKKQNEKIKQERADLINRFTDDDINRYCSNRYDK